jgi:hypothetical protein
LPPLRDPSHRNLAGVAGRALALAERMYERTILVITLAGCGVDVVAISPLAPYDMTERSGSRLKIERWESSDGVETFRGVFDTAIGEDCAFHVTASGERACLPVSGAPVDHPALVRFQIEDVPLPIVPAALVSDDGFQLPWGFFDRSGPGTCSAMRVPGTGRFVCASPGHPPTEGDPALDLVPQPGAAHRLRHMVFTTADGMIQHSETMNDSALAIDCTFREPTSSTTALCMPPITNGDVAATQPERALADYVAAVPTIDP